HEVVGLAADQGIAAGDRAADAGAAAAPGHRTGVAEIGSAPCRASHHVVAVGQRGDTASAHGVVGLAADQGIAAGDRAADAGAAAAPGHRAGTGGRAVGAGAVRHDVVAVGQRGDTAIAHGVVGSAADQGIAAGDRAADAGAAAAPGHRTGVA